MRIAIIALTALLLASPLTCGASHTSDTIADVSILQLIATPEKFDGKAVRVIGFLRTEFEGNALYLHREDYTQQITKNAIWLEFGGDPENRGKLADLDMSYVSLIGTFDATNKGHRSLASGSIHSSPNQIIGWPPRTPASH